MSNDSRKIREEDGKSEWDREEKERRNHVWIDVNESFTAKKERTSSCNPGEAKGFGRCDEKSEKKSTSTH